MSKNDLLLLRLLLLLAIDCVLALVWVGVQEQQAEVVRRQLVPTLAPTAMPVAFEATPATPIQIDIPPAPVVTLLPAENQMESTRGQGVLLAAFAAINTPTATRTAEPIPTPTVPAIPTRLWPAPDITLPTPPTPIPTPMPPFAESPATVNILLLGNDVDWSRGGRTDTMIIVSINREAGTASMLSLPRDLYVYVPGWTMSRLNAALPHGNLTDYPGGGIALLKDTLLYNFGIQIDYYARVGFKNFKQIVNAIGGVELVVTCSLRDWRLKAPNLDVNVEDNWEQFTLASGVHVMDGDLALWYARSRRTTNDFERGRRQQQLLRAVLDQGVKMDMIGEAPRLWEAFHQFIDTDMDLNVFLELAAVAPAVRNNGVQSLHLAQEGVRKAWTVPTTGEMVQLLQWDTAEKIFVQLLQTPTLGRAGRSPITVEVVTWSDRIYRLAAEKPGLVWFCAGPWFYR